MRFNIANFDPSLKASDYFTVNMPNGGYLEIMNRSAINLIFNFGPGVGNIPAGASERRIIEFCQPFSDQVQWQQDTILSNSAQFPISQCVVYGYTLDTPPSANVQYIPLTQNVGNQVSTTTSQSLINDGNAAGTQFLEATPLGQAGSSVLLFNDASGLFQVLSAGVMRTIYDVNRGDSGTTKATVVLGDSGDKTITNFYGIGNFSTATSNNGETLPTIKSAGGGAAGIRIWVGTTDPGGSASEGDIWING
jgi:hypothetical protein